MRGLTRLNRTTRKIPFAAIFRTSSTLPLRRQIIVALDLLLHFRSSRVHTLETSPPIKTTITRLRAWASSLKTFPWGESFNLIGASALGSPRVSRAWIGKLYLDGAVGLVEFHRDGFAPEELRQYRSANNLQ